MKYLIYFPGKHLFLRARKVQGDFTYSFTPMFSRAYRTARRDRIEKILHHISYAIHYGDGIIITESSLPIIEAMYA